MDSVKLGVLIIGISLVYVVIRLSMLIVKVNEIGKRQNMLAVAVIANKEKLDSMERGATDDGK